MVCFSVDEIIKQKISKWRRLRMARLAQSVERGTFNPKVKGSSPLSGVRAFVANTLMFLFIISFQYHDFLYIM